MSGELPAGLGSDLDWRLGIGLDRKRGQEDKGTGGQEDRRTLLLLGLSRREEGVLK